MQFADAILWYIKMKKTPLNYFVTSYVIPVILVAQVLFNLSIINKLNPIIYLPITLFFIFLSSKIRGYSTASCSYWGSPIWGSKEFTPIEIISFYIAIFYPTYTIYSILPIIALPIITTGGFGSMWCAIGCITSIYLLLKFR